MLVVRFKVTCRPEKTEQIKALLADVVAPSRNVRGVLHFDIGRDLRNPDEFIATEVFEDRAALERQESLSEVGAVLAVLEESLAAEPEATLFHVASAEPWGA